MKDLQRKFIIPLNWTPIPNECPSEGKQLVQRDLKLQGWSLIFFFHLSFSVLGLSAHLSLLLYYL